MSSLRSRLIVSHTLPAVVSLHLIGFLLIYMVETQVLLPYFSQKLMQQATLLALIAADSPTIWQEQAQAQQFVTRFSAPLTAQLMLLTPDGVLLATTDPQEQSRLGMRLALPTQMTIQQASAFVQTNYSRDWQSEVVDVYLPVPDQRSQVVGIVRLTHRYATIYDRIRRLRYVMLPVFAIGLLSNIVIGFWLALSLARPLRRLTQALPRFGQGSTQAPLPEAGPTEARTLIRTFNRLVEQQRQHEQEQRHLLANLIHEIRRPLGALNSATYALLHGADADAALRTELLKGMASEFQHFQQILTDLTLLQEQALGVITLDRQPTDLHEWLTTNLAHWRQAAEQKGLTWQAIVPETLGVLPIDPIRLAQALGNLISNAIKFTPAPGAITIAAGIDSETYWISVSDSGPGIDPQEQQQIFEPFYRSPAHQQLTHGMGIGLTIAHDLVAAHGGQLTITSQLTEGSQFTIHLPRQPLASAANNEHDSDADFE